MATAVQEAKAEIQSAMEENFKPIKEAHDTMKKVLDGVLEAFRGGSLLDERTSEQAEKELQAKVESLETEMAALKEEKEALEQEKAELVKQPYKCPCKGHPWTFPES